MVISDSQTGQQLFESVLPKDFTVRAAKNVLNYPDNSRVCFELAAERNGCRITYQTGGSYVYEKKRFQSPFGGHSIVVSVDENGAFTGIDLVG